MPLFIYQCGSGHLAERLLGEAVGEVKCLECGLVSRRVWSGQVVQARQPEVDTRGMFRRWREASMEAEAKGADLPTYRDGQRRAEAYERAGEPLKVRS